MYRKKNIIIGIMCLVIAFMGIVFAIFETRLTITGTGNVLGEWNIAITNIESVTTGTAQNLSSPTYGGTNATIHAGLKKPGDKIVYAITVTNSGNIDALIIDVLINTTGASEVVYGVENLNKNQKLSKGSSFTFNLITEFNRDATYIPAISSKQIDISMVVLQDDGSTPTPIAPEITDTTTQYGIMYVANGGIGLMNGTVCQVGQSCVIATNTFTKEGYKFKGWSTTPSGDIEYTNGQTVTDLTTKGKTQVLYAVWENVQLVYYIMNDNTAYADNVSSPYVTNSTGIDFSQISSDTNGKGLYYTSTNTENNQRTYYFRGAVENNFVQFGKDSNGNDLYWKIVRINEDGSIRIIYNGTSTTATGANVTIGNSKFNTNSGDNAYVGYMYGSTGQSGDNAYNLTHSNDNPSTIKTYIDNWYTNNTNLSNYKDSHLADAGFCNDRSVAPSAGLWDSDDTALGYAKNVTYYGAYNRLSKNKKPQFACPNASNDLFTTSTSSKGNKALTKPIGLLTADEVMYAGAIYNISNTSYYLYTGVSYWTMSPRYFSGSYAHEWDVGSFGYLSHGDVNYSGYGVRPVANLQSGVEIINGDGTSGNPYVIK